VKEKKPPVYDPESFQNLCISAGSTKLFDTLLNSMTAPRHSVDRIQMNKKRVVSMIYKMCYSLSQTCNLFEIDHALYLKSSNINQEGIDTEHNLGHSCSRRTVDSQLHRMAESHFVCFEAFIREAIQNKWLLVLILDDYTSIHTKRRPQVDKASEAKSMCTIIVKAFKNIPAIKSQGCISIHDPYGVNIESCQNIITSASSMHDLSRSYASVMSEWIRSAFFNPELERQRINTHRYSDNDNVRTMRKMENLHLLDFIELRLKSKNDFEAAYDVIMSTGMADYMQQFVVIQPGDWPCQFYCRQIIYQCLQKQNLFNSGPNYRCHTPDDHSYSFQSPHSSENIQATNFTATVENTPSSSTPAILSIVPSIGPLHISLNSREHIVTTFHPFFKLIYETLFPRSILANNPKPWRVSLLLEIVYGGWTVIRESVIRKCSKFKNLEYGTLFNLLDNYIPLVLSIYSISFKLNNYTEYFRAIIRIWIMFTCLRRRHYNKAPLVWISMCSYWGKHSPQLFDLLRNYLAIFDEYPVENVHSILRAQTNPSDTAEELRRKAKSIFHSKDRQSNFRSFFTSPKQFSFSQSQLRFLKMKCAQILTSIIQKIIRSPGQSFMTTNTRSQQRSSCTLPTMFPNTSTKTTVLPLGYQTEIKPDKTKTCDLPECQISNEDTNWTILHGCSHSFHDICLKGSLSCPLCKEFLQKKVRELGEVAKNAILNPASNNNGHASCDEDTSAVDSTDNEGSNCPNVREMDFGEFDNVIQQLNNEITNLDPPPQPCNTHTNPTPCHNTSIQPPLPKPPHCRKCHHLVRGHTKLSNVNLQSICPQCPNNICTPTRDQSTCTCSWHASQNTQSRNHQSTSQNTQSTSHQSTMAPRANTSATSIQIGERKHMDITEWLLPSTICQSNIHVGGRQNGSNACTVIAVFGALQFLQGLLKIPNQMSDLSHIHVVASYIQIIRKGNEIYDSFHCPVSQPNLDVRQVMQKKQSHL